MINQMLFEYFNVYCRLTKAAPCICYSKRTLFFFVYMELLPINTSSLRKSSMVGIDILGLLADQTNRTMDH